LSSDKTTEGSELVYPPSPETKSCRTLNLPCFLLSTHSANEDFYGREDILERLAAELLPSKNTSGSGLRQFALCGLGGIGKTEIAREFSRRYKDSYAAVFWVVADGIAKLDHHYQQISLALALEDQSECKSQVISRELVKRWLSNPQTHLSGTGELVNPGQTSSEATWLLILDNADDPMILANYWPQGSGSVLVTSRDPLAKSMFTSRTSGLDLGPLSQEDSLSLFKYLTVNEPEDDTARQISNVLGGFPLAISQMAAILRRRDLTLSQFLYLDHPEFLYQDYEEHASLYGTKFDTNLLSYSHSLSTVWAVENLRPKTRRLLELISFLDPDAIGDDFLMEASVKFLADGEFKRLYYGGARGDLLRLSLIQKDKRNRQISIHRLVQDLILATMDVETKQLRFDQVVQLLWKNWPSALPKPSKEPELSQPVSSGNRLCVIRWSVCAGLYPHILRIHQLWPNISHPSEATRILFATLLNEAAWCVYHAQTLLLLYVLMSSGIKRSVDEQGNSTAFLKVPAASANPQHMQIEILSRHVVT
jgi:hypothetical protein